MKVAFTLFSLVSAVSAFSVAPAFQRQSTKLFGEFGASSTSFYTTTEKQDSYASLDDILTEKCKDEKVRAVIRDMLDVCADITEALRTALVTVEGSMNDFGDAQLSVDVRLENEPVSGCVGRICLALSSVSNSLRYAFFYRLLQTTLSGMLLRGLQLSVRVPLRKTLSSVTLMKAVRVNSLSAGTLLMDLPLSITTGLLVQ